MATRSTPWRGQTSRFYRYFTVFSNDNGCIKRALGGGYEDA
ncbi:MAG TPA: hypothetical protein VEK55_06340 [Xanthobacteraceae bacterium]|nr:hypothetical protein [Xanthobacteraceae bacterium]